VKGGPGGGGGAGGSQVGALVGMRGPLPQTKAGLERTGGSRPAKGGRGGKWGGPGPEDPPQPLGAGAIGLLNFRLWHPSLVQGGMNRRGNYSLFLVGLGCAFPDPAGAGAPSGHPFGPAREPGADPRPAGRGRSTDEIDSAQSPRAFSWPACSPCPVELDDGDPSISGPSTEGLDVSPRISCSSRRGRERGPPRRVLDHDAFLDAIGHLPAPLGLVRGKKSGLKIGRPALASLKPQSNFLTSRFNLGRHFVGGRGNFSCFCRNACPKFVFRGRNSFPTHC